MSAATVAELAQARELRQRIVADLAAVDQRITDLEREELDERRALWDPALIELRIGARISFTDHTGGPYAAVVHYNHPDEGFLYVHTADGEMHCLYKGRLGAQRLEIVEASAVLS